MSTKQIRSLTTVLIANRGEIAVRVARTLRRMGYRTVAVYSDVDYDSLHVKVADSAICLGAAPPAESYLNIAGIIDAARRSGADAIHPGYGFLAENADFADAVAAAGLIFVGPPAEAIRAMGNKAQAKDRAQAADIPCIPGYQGSQEDADFISAARDIGAPLMVKAAAGGGGRGMRLVTALQDLPAALASARSEAQAAFGSDELILERAVLAPRHIEIQILADSHGQVIHLGERDCSVQRRHQKLIEEAPSPAVNAQLRAAMGAAAVRAAQAIGYVGAGTVEFLLDQDGQFYFMEMNTRLQVEHAVTEAITGLDLVEWQMRVAAGQALDMAQDEVALHGHAIEVRLTAEDVAAGFLPQTGTLLRWRAPGEDFGVRVDHGLVEGGEISPYYDSMVAKLIAYGATRDEARRKLLRAVENCVLLGLPSNQGFLADCLAHPVFAAGQAHTGFVADHFADPKVLAPVPEAGTVAMAALALLTEDGQSVLQPGLGSSIVSPRIAIKAGGQQWQVRLSARPDGWLAEVAADAADPDAQAAMLELRHIRRDDATLQAEINGVMQRATVAIRDDVVHLFLNGRAWVLARRGDAAQAQEKRGTGAVTAPLTGRVVGVLVQSGEQVQAGQALIVLEAMKMEHTLTAAIAGEVAELNVAAGSQTTLGALLMRIAPAQPEGAAP